MCLDKHLEGKVSLDSCSEQGELGNLSSIFYSKNHRGKYKIDIWTFWILEVSFFFKFGTFLSLIELHTFLPIQGFPVFWRLETETAQIKAKAFICVESKIRNHVALCSPLSKLDFKNTSLENYQLLTSCSAVVYQKVIPMPL